MIADVVHEVIGHGGTCLALGNKITLLGSVYFRSTPTSALTDAGGPLANLAAGLIVCGVMALKCPRSPLAALLMLSVAAYNLFWFCGTLVQSGFSNEGDWIEPLRVLHLESLHESALLAFGITFYLVSARLIAVRLHQVTRVLPEFPVREACVIAFTGAAMAAVLAGLCYRPDRWQGAVQGGLEMVSSLPVLLIDGYTKTERRYQVSRAFSILALLAAMLLVVFCLTLGEGLATT